MKGGEKSKNSRSNLQPFSRNWNGWFTHYINLPTEATTLECPPSFQCVDSYRNYGSGPAKYPLADMLQFVLEFATTKPSSASPAEDLRPNCSSPTPCSQSLSENDNRLDVSRVDWTHSIIMNLPALSTLIPCPCQ